MYRESFENIHSIYKEFDKVEKISILKNGKIKIKFDGTNLTFKNSHGLLTILDQL